MVILFNVTVYIEILFIINLSQICELIIYVFNISVGALKLEQWIYISLDIYIYMYKIVSYTG